MIKHNALFWLVLVLLFSGGCTRHPSSLADIDELCSSQCSGESFEREAGWWKMYGDPGLDSVMERALSRNIDLKKSALAAQRARYQFRLNETNLLPELGGSLGARRSENWRNGESGESFSGELGLSYEVDLWKRLDLTTEADEQEYLASRQDQRAARLSLISAVVNGWFQIGSLEQSLQLMTASVQRYRTLCEIVRFRVESGKDAAIHLAQARQSLLQAESSLAGLQNSRVTALQSLANLLDLKQEEMILPQPRPLAEAAETVVNLNVPIAVLSQRPDVMAAEARLQAASLQQKGQQRNWYPKISLQAGISSSAETPGRVFAFPVGVGSLNLSLPFLAWNKLVWQDKTAEANVAGAHLDFAQKITTALNEVSTLYQQYDAAKAALTRDQERYRLDRENSRYHKQRYDVGAAGLADWLEALNAEYGSAQTIVQDQYEILKYINLIYTAMGGCYAFREP